ncbi:MAG: hypothetical protein K2X00_04115 [Nitrospiraceae bacterium]|nr:hypothetical protein [Nitrospiraceae bacterium]OQW64528.1 MAG: hypothetical protein BVN29_11935 [Nitrospira sp. ST-bin5]
MTVRNLPRWLLFGAGCLLLGLALALRPTPVVSLVLSTQPRFEYRVLEVLPDTRSIQAVLTEYGQARWELAVVEMGDLQTPRLIFKKGVPAAP